MNYYQIVIYYNRPNHPRITGHVIRAKSKTDALRIREKYGISTPMNSKDIRNIQVETIRKKYFDMLNLKRRGINGNIWYEDKEGNLQTEKI
jgi:hypothetical protein